MPSPVCAPSCCCTPQVVIVEFGGNDGLRGLPLDQTRRNLDAVLTALENAHIKILLAGITLPPNYGSEYIRQFDQVFRDLAKKHHTAFVPMIYKDLVHVPGTIQPDGIHPTAKGSEIIARTLLPRSRRCCANDRDQGSEIRDQKNSPVPHPFVILSEVRRGGRSRRTCVLQFPAKGWEGSDLSVAGSITSPSRSTN